MMLNDVSARDIQAMDKQFTRASHLMDLLHVDHGLQQDEIDDLKTSNLQQKLMVKLDRILQHQICS